MEMTMKGFLWGMILMDLGGHWSESADLFRVPSGDKVLVGLVLAPAYDVLKGQHADVFEERDLHVVHRLLKLDLTAVTVRIVGEGVLGAATTIAADGVKFEVR